jgi:hypothetical protein
MNPSEHSIRITDGHRLTYKGPVSRRGKVKSHKYQSEDGTVTAYQTVRDTSSPSPKTPPGGIHTRLLAITNSVLHASLHVYYICFRR